MSIQQRPEIKTWANLEAAFAGESMAHIKYRYFAKLAREAGDEATARAFEETADQEVQHAFGHLDLLYPKAEITPARALEEAAFRYDGPTPQFKESAIISLADVVEAATRSLREANPTQLAELITRVVNQRIAEGQLYSAPLTLEVYLIHQRLD